MTLYFKVAIKHCCVKHLSIENKFRKNLCNVFLPEIAISLRPESSENIPILLQGADLYFSNQNDLRNPKMGSKQSVVVPPYYWFFQKTVFRQKKLSKKLDILLIFEFLWQYIWISNSSLKKFNFRTFRISWNITKMLKTDQFFHKWLFIFEKQLFSCCCSYNRLF